MSGAVDADLALAVLAIHVAIIIFNVGGLIAIPVGAWRQWRWVRRFGWRLAHLLILAAVALQALLGRACFLTLWQSALAGQSHHPVPLIMSWIDRLVFWPLPIWFFVALYTLVWIYTLLLWWWVPPLPAKRR